MVTINIIDNLTNGFSYRYESCTSSWMPRQWTRLTTNDCWHIYSNVFCVVVLNIMDYGSDGNCDNDDEIMNDWVDALKE